MEIVPNKSLRGSLSESLSLSLYGHTVRLLLWSLDFGLWTKALAGFGPGAARARTAP